MALPRPQGLALPAHPLRDQRHLTSDEVKMLLATLPGLYDQYLLGRQLQPLVDDLEDTDIRPLELRVKTRYYYDDGEGLCYHWRSPQLAGEKQPWGSVRPMLYCCYKDEYEDCLYKEAFSERLRRRNQYLPLVIPLKGQRYPPGECPAWRLPQYAIESWAFIGSPMPGVNAETETGVVDSWLMDEEQDDQYSTLGQSFSDSIHDESFDKECIKLFQYFRTPTGIPYAATLLRKILEDFTFLAEDVNDHLLVELKGLGKRPSNTAKWPRPSDPVWSERLERISNYLFISNGEPYLEQRQITGKQYIVYELLALRELHEAHADLKINWHKCRELVEDRMELTRRYVDAMDMDHHRIEQHVLNAVRPLMDHILPSRARQDRNRAERVDTGQHV